jgi:hypothetical protein
MHVNILPHQTLGFYAHSNLPDDLGIQYQSYQRDSVVAENDHLRITPGVGHTGSTPFDEQHGWYRAYRGPAGSIGYSARAKGFNIFTFKLFPQATHRAVVTLLLINACLKNSVQLNKLHKYILYNILEYTNWEWFKEEVSSPPSPSKPLPVANHVYNLRNRTTQIGVTATDSDRTLTSHESSSRNNTIFYSGQSAVTTYDEDEYSVDYNVEDEDDDDFNMGDTVGGDDRVMTILARPYLHIAQNDITDEANQSDSIEVESDEDMGDEEDDEYEDVVNDCNNMDCDADDMAANV